MCVFVCIHGGGHPSPKTALETIDMAMERSWTDEADDSGVMLFVRQINTQPREANENERLCPNWHSSWQLSRERLRYKEPRTANE